MKPLLLVGIGGGNGAVQRHEPLVVLLNVVASVVCGVCALWLGIRVM